MYNIPDDIIEYAKQFEGLELLATGGGCDYVFAPIDNNNNGESNGITLSDSEDATSPDSLDSPCELVFMFEEWQGWLSLGKYKTAKQGIHAMAFYVKANTYK